ncbi:MAG: 30S ribosomal protein S5 alanine N-acetyltransferase [Rhodospirillaceae bacterium]|nr:30S ribosomal protein S5 alanine N-acetyltransferase [Rhodospirillaceae bacterium]
MALSFLLPTHSEPKIVLRRVYLRPPVRGDWIKWVRIRSESREFLVPWEPTWPADALTKGAFRRRLSKYSEDWSEDKGYSFFIFRREDDALIGGITLANVRRGVAQIASFGYWIGKSYARNGYMTESVRGASGFAFDKLSLHRMEAACLPENIASQGVLKKVGFNYEGLARKYLKINGEWKDHMVFALLGEEFNRG